MGGGGGNGGRGGGRGEGVGGRQGEEAMESGRVGGVSKTPRIFPVGGRGWWTRALVGGGGGLRRGGRGRGGMEGVTLSFSLSFYVALLIRLSLFTFSPQHAVELSSPGPPQSFSGCVGVVLSFAQTVLTFPS